jgi:ATP synthase subunit 6
MLTFSPLEQFLVLPLLSFSLFNTSIAYFVVSNFSLMVGLLLLVATIIFQLNNKGNLKVFTYFHLFLNDYYIFVTTIIRENFVKKGFYFLPYLFLLISFLLLANLMGMVPYSFAVTSHFAITLFFSFLSFFTGVFLGFQQHGLVMFSLFLPDGAPFVLAPFLIIVETISYIARVFSLAIRLFANIMSGHTLLKILAGFGWVLLVELASLIGLVPVLVVFVITGLEIVIAFLQAYVFTVLSAIYLNEAIQLH